MYDTLYDKKFEVVDLLTLLQSIHNVQDGTCIHIPIENINKFQQALEKKGYECCLNIEDFERFNTNDIERFNNTVVKIFEVDNNIIKITFNQRIIRDYCFWNFGVHSVLDIMTTWYETNYNIQITSLSTSEIAVGEYFLYDKKLYKCCEDESYTACSECSLYDNDNEKCPITNNTIKHCCQFDRNDKKWIHYCEVKPFEFNDNTIIYISSNLSSKKIETPKSNSIDLDKVISSLPKIKELQDKLWIVNYDLDDLDRIKKHETIYINEISILYNDNDITTIRKDVLPQPYLEEIRDFITQKLQEYKQKIENEIKDILLN